MFDMISIFLSLFWLVLCPFMWNIFENVPSAFKRLCILLLWDERLYVYQLSPFDVRHCSMLQYLLIICLEDVGFNIPLSIFDRGVLKSPTLILLLSIAFLKYSKNFLMFLGVPMFGAYIYF